jgi:NAD(P)-dependent dehydrogenase (short-subunit alcohol dehydrogenase family)
VNKTLLGKVALVTGAGSGIGRATALEMAAEGACIIVNDVNAESAQRTVSLIAEKGEHALAVPGDIGVSKNVDMMVQAGLNAFGKIDILVNNAGVNCIKPDGFLTLTNEEWDRTLAVNLNGAFYCCRAVIPNMLARKAGGKIINISSVQALQAHFEATAYQPSKSALTMLTTSLAVEFAPYKINVNAIAPGAIASEGIGSGAPPEHLEAFRRRIPWGARGYPRDIATVAVFLASDASRYMTGQTLVVDGGFLSDSTPTPLKRYFHPVPPDDPDL